jgi:hypothetical protein
MSKDLGRGDIDREQRDLKEKYEKTQQEYQKDANTKKVLADVSARLNMSGTREGKESVKRGMEVSDQATERKFTQDESEHVKTMEQVAKPLTKDLADMTAKTSADANEAAAAKSKVEIGEAVAGIEKAIEAAREDADFTDKKTKEVEDERKRSEAVKNDFKNKMSSLKLSFRK